jgi:hypothetical protein
MGLQIRAYVDGAQKFIDLYDDEKISIDVSFAEVQDITKKNSAFTKEFKVPGSKNNNDIFNYFFDINTVALDWNPKKKFEADLLYDGYEIFNGYVRMNSVTIDKIEKIYSITFYSSMGDLAANIGDKGLCEVDTSSLDHSIYSPYIAPYLLDDASLKPTSMLPNTTQWQLQNNQVTNGDVKYILGQRGYDYTGSTFGTILDIDTQNTPILEFSNVIGGTPGFFDYYKTPLVSSYLIPSIRTRKLYELIVNQAGYNIESNFFDTDYFGRYYIPLSFNAEGLPYMAQAAKNDFAWDNNNPTNGALSGITVESFYSPIITATTTMVRPIVVTKDNLDFNPVDDAHYPFISTSIFSAYTSYLFGIPTNNRKPYSYQTGVTVKYVGEVLVHFVFGKYSIQVPHHHYLKLLLD